MKAMTNAHVTSATATTRGAFDNSAIEMTHRAALRSIARVVEDTTEPTEPAAALRLTSELFRRGPALVLTGAGVSTASGIPDYRGPQGSLRRHRPMTYQEFRYDQAASHRYWARSFVGWRTMRAASPNRTHFSLVELERAGLLTGVVTQNVDGLHREAGSKQMINLHGDMETVVCLTCGYREIRRDLDARLEAANTGYLESILIDEAMVNPDGDVTLPEEVVSRFTMPGCLRCSSVALKPDVVYFGESVPREKRQQAQAMLDRSEFLLVAGSSLAVMSGYKFVLDAQRAGKPVVVINGGPGRADARVEVLWRSEVGAAFDQLLDELDL